jgi:hypothetical protein
LHNKSVILSERSESKDLRFQGAYHAVKFSGTTLAGGFLHFKNGAALVGSALQAGAMGQLLLVAVGAL